MRLVEPGYYQRRTGDTATDLLAVGVALAEAQTAIGEHCRRWLAYGTYTETLPVNRAGRVYPRATPIDPAQAISPPTARVTGGAFIDTVGGAWSMLDGATPPPLAITYTGGYQPVGTTDGPTPPLPAKLANAIAQLAYTALNPSALSGQLARGATSVSVGDVSMGGKAALITAALIDEDLAASIAGFVRRDLIPAATRRAW